MRINSQKKFFKALFSF